MSLLKMTFATFCIFLISCCGSKEQASKANTTENKATMERAEKMMANGFLKGTIVYSEAENDCPYTIKVEGDEPYFLDPVNLENSFKTDGAEIWFKFTGLRRMNRCEKANPVNITEMQKRGE